MPYLPIDLSKLVDFSIGSLSLLQPNLNFMLFSSKVLPCPLLRCLTFHSQILLSLGWPGGTVRSWYIGGLQEKFQV